MSSRTRLILIQALILVLIAVFFQNCASEFDESAYKDNSSETPDPDTTSTQLPTSRTFTGGDLILSKGQSVETTELILIQQNDGNLVVYKKPIAENPAALWASHTVSSPTVDCATDCYTTFQGDGNFVSYARVLNTAILKSFLPICASQGEYCDYPYWSSGKIEATSNFSLTFQNAAPYVFIQDSSGVRQWN